MTSWENLGLPTLEPREAPFGAALVCAGAACSPEEVRSAAGGLVDGAGRAGGFVLHQPRGTNPNQGMSSDVLLLHVFKSSDQRSNSCGRFLEVSAVRTFF